MRLIIIVLFSIFNCASFGNYFQNRKDDLADIPVIGIEENVFGVSAWAWCFGGGMQYGKNGLGVGIRSGVIGYYKTGGRGSRIYVSTYENSDLSLNQGNSFVVLNSNSHLPKVDEPRTKKKAFSKFNTNIIFPLGATQSSTGEIIGKWCDSPISVEMSFGIYYGIRVGFNFSEAFDFLVGVTTIDIQEDDINK